VVPEGCQLCRTWPRERFLWEGEPEPPTRCPSRGLAWHGITRVIPIVRVVRGDDDG